MHFVTAKGILSSKNAMNLYRGCSHGCIYCDSRSRCYHMDHAFEDIEVKENAVELLENALQHKRKKCMISTGSMTDPYIPLEMEIGNVRKALHLIDEYSFGFTVITKSDRILRDIDLLQKINEKTKCVVQMTLTTCDEDLCRNIEPNVSTTGERFEVLKQMRDAGIPTIVWMTPILPFINDTESNISGILDMCIEADVYGIICYGMGLTLREGNREYFYKQLDRLFPQLKEKYIRTYGNQYIVTSPDHDRLMTLFYEKCRRNGIIHNNEQLFSYLHTFEEKNCSRQMTFFDFV
ncbi:MAG: radical SAM protein [Eubacterium sp.]|nr:radical SAM protein [Eubacterium sp.]